LEPKTGAGMIELEKTKLKAVEVPVLFNIAYKTVPPSPWLTVVCREASGAINVQNTYQFKTKS
jgi:hypothetical protein